MDAWLVWVLVIGGGIVLVAIAQRLGWVDFSNKAGRSGSGAGGAFGALDEVFSPTRHEAQAELDRQAVLPIPAPVPDNGDMSDEIYKGTVRIDLSGDERR